MVQTPQSKTIVSPPFVHTSLKTSPVSPCEPVARHDQPSSTIRGSRPGKAPPAITFASKAAATLSAVSQPGPVAPRKEIRSMLEWHLWKTGGRSGGATGGCAGGRGAGRGAGGATRRAGDASAVGDATGWVAPPAGSSGGPLADASGVTSVALDTAGEPFAQPLSIRTRSIPATVPGLLAEVIPAPEASRRAPAGRASFRPAARSPFSSSCGS